MISKIPHFFEEEMWRIRLKDLPSVKAYPIRYLRVTALAFRRFYDDQCSQKASALTYYSLLSIVPVLAMMFGVAKGFGLEKLIQDQIIQMAQRANWQAGIADKILDFSHSLLMNAKGGLIAGVGVILVFWTVISIMGHIEESFNDIWEIRKARTLKRKFSDYLSIMILAPFLQIISSSVAVLVASNLKVIVKKIAVLGIFAPVITFLLQLLPYLSIWALLVLLYLIMPNTKVPFKSAILAGIVTGTIFQVVQWIYIKFQIGVSGYGTIYGSFAALPLFLVWLQLSWMIVLFGAEIAAAHEHYETYGYHPDYSRMSLSSRKILVLRVFHLIVKKFSQGEKPLTAAQITHTLEIPVRLVRSLLHELTGAGLITETVIEKNNEVAFQPGRTIEGITVKYALDAYEQHGTEPISLSASGEEDRILTHLRRISDLIEKSPDNVALKEI
ncbi:MAG: YihY/virulence factor BrkB family protein [Deltaproteobacteria bacterium]